MMIVTKENKIIEYIFALYITASCNVNYVSYIVSLFICLQIYINISIRSFTMINDHVCGNVKLCHMEGL